MKSDKQTNSKQTSKQTKPQTKQHQQTVSEGAGKTVNQVHQFSHTQSGGSGGNISTHYHYHDHYHLFLEENPKSVFSVKSWVFCRTDAEQTRSRRKPRRCCIMVLHRLPRTQPALLIHTTKGQFSIRPASESDPKSPKPTRPQFYIRILNGSSHTPPLFAPRHPSTNSPA